MADGEEIRVLPVTEQASDVDDFDAPARADADADIDALIVNIDGYEGPLDVLLDLARTQKVDIRRISMVALVDQYLVFVGEAKKRDLELAAADSDAAVIGPAR